MNIAKYENYFHDGSLIDIAYGADEILFSIESAEMDPEDLSDPIELSERKTIKGKLHVRKVKSISINDAIFFDKLYMKYDYGEIMHLEVKKNGCRIEILWANSRNKPRVNDYSTIVIEAEGVEWENIPDLYDPFW